MTILARFGQFVAGLDAESLGPCVQHHARRALLDWTGSLIAGADTDLARRLIAAYDNEYNSGPCQVPGSTGQYPLRAAAFLLGSVSHIAEFDDIFRDGIYHPASPIISAAWALGTQQKTSLHSLLTAIVAGYEVSTRIASVLQPSHYQFFHTTGTVGVIGAAAASARLLGLEAAQATHAMALASTFASGLQQAFRTNSMSKPTHAGHAAEVGVNAACMAAKGVSGAPDILEGDYGLGKAMCAAPRWDEVLNGLGDAFNITQITFKNHGCCGHTFAAIDGVAHLMKSHSVQAADIQSIEIAAYAAALDVCKYRHPASAFEAKFSLTHTVASQVVLGSVRERAFLDAAIGNPEIMRVEDLVQVESDSECTQKFPSERGTKVRLRLHNGGDFYHYQKTRHGDPDDPMTDDELIDKFRELAVARIGPLSADALTQAILSGGGQSVSDLARFWKFFDD